MAIAENRIQTRNPYFTGAELRPFPDGATLVITSAGNLYRVEADPATVQQFLQVCDGTRPLADIVAATPDPTAFTEVLHMLIDDGTILPAVPQPGDGMSGATPMLLLGDPALLTLARQIHGVAHTAALHVIPSADLGNALLMRSETRPLVVVLREQFDGQFFTWVDTLCAEREVPWVSFHLDQGQGWLGPLIVPGATANYHDLLVRRRCAADYEDVFAALLAPPFGASALRPSPSALTWMVSRFFAEITQWLNREECRLLSAELLADPVTLNTTLYPVLPLPDRQLQGALRISVPCDPQALISERAGIVLRLREIEHHPSIPAQLKTVQADVTNSGRHFKWANDIVCGGSAFGDSELARQSALGEAVERYSGNQLWNKPLRFATYDELLESGEYALDPERLVLYGATQYATPGFPFVPLSRTLRVHWVAGHSLTHDRPAWLPASMVYVNWYRAEFAHDPPTNNLAFPGIAAGPALDAAIASAIEEIVERDATMIWWMNRQPLPSLELPPDLAALWHGRPTELGQRAWLIYLPNEFDIPVMAGVVENTHEQLINIGFAARPTARQAGLKAWTEALTLQEGSRDLLAPDDQSQIRQSVERGEFFIDLFKPWRADRAYLDAYRPDFRDVNDLMCQQQVFLDPRAREVIRPWVDTPAVQKIEDLPALPDRSAATYQARIEARGYELFAIDLTAPDVAACGLRVVRVIIPGLVPNFPAAFPCLGNGRIQHAAVALGWRATPLPEDALNYFPLPHA